MKILKTIWNYLEQQWFGYRFAPAVSSILLLLLIQLLTLAGVLALFFDSMKLIQGESLYLQFSLTFKAALAVAGGGLLLSSLLGFLIFSMLVYLGSRPLNALNELFRDMARGSTDLSKDFPELPYKELAQVSPGFNAFMDNIRNIIENIRRTGIKIAIDSTKVKKTVETTCNKSETQREYSSMVNHSSRDANTAIKEISGNARHVAESTTSNLDSVRHSYGELLHVSEKMEMINKTVASFKSTVEELKQNSSGIMDIVVLINSISDETNLLSLNATIEAARAGEHGKGFTVVAEEVRTLARRVKPATQDIAEKVQKMSETVERTIEETNAIISSSSEVDSTISKTSKNFKSMIEALEGTNEQLLKISAAIDELSVTNDTVNSKVGEINLFSQEIFSDMTSSALTVQGFNEITENMQEMISGYTTGRGVLDEIISLVRYHRDHIQKKIKDISDRGINIFDHNYRKIPGTNPQKYNAAFTEEFKRSFQDYVDKMLRDIPGAIYALAIDQKGYLPVHHSHVSKPVTGDYETDLANSRDRRIFFSIPTEQRRATHTSPLLLQTYMRDTGEILNDLSMPIMVDGRHWGAVIVGINPNIFF
ncbi:MAG: methyl-accepting chemotaxis protein [Desulfamplus sp.]|nr:methyl-accepting chemotaxis protein [Desulfamplus sp.]